MSRFLFVLPWALYLGSCSASHGAGDTGRDDADAPGRDGAMTDSGTLDAAAVDDAPAALDARDASGVFTLTAGAPTFQTCTCHHGCGPGIDGTFVVDARNADSVAHAVRITDATLTPFGTPGGPFIASRDGYLRVTGAAADGSVTVAPGAVSAIEVVVYLDIPMTLPGTYRIDIAVLVDGTTSMLALDAVSVPLVGGCP